MDIPPPVSDVIEGQLFRPKDSSNLLLILGENPPIRFEGKLLANGMVRLSYAFALYVNDDALLPQLVLDDFRRSYTGLDAIKFLLQKGDTYPRADVIGSGAMSGRHREHYLKEIDLGSPIKVAAYKDDGLAKFIGFVNLVLQLDETQEPGTWTDIRTEIGMPLLARTIPCIQLHPDSVLEIVPELLDD